MNQEQVVLLMESSKSGIEWTANCDKVKKTCGGNYPDFWYTAILASGLCRRITSAWGSTDEIKVTEI